MALALLTKMSMPPKVSTAFFTAASNRGLVAHVDEARQGLAARLLDLFGGGVDGAGELGVRLGGLGGDHHVGPSRAARSAMARPMPRLAPVMNRVLPERFSISRF
jgi:hypothetical protein